MSTVREPVVDKLLVKERSSLNSNIEDDDLKGPKKKKNHFKVWQYAETTDWLLIVGAIILNTASGLLLPYFMSIFGNIMDVIGLEAADEGDLPPGMEPPDGHPLIWYIRLQFYFGVASFFLCWGGAGLMEFAAERQLRTIKQQFVRAITRQEMGWFDKFDAGELGSKLNESTKVIREAIGMKFAQLWTFVGIFVGGYIVGLIRGWKLALVVSASLPLLALAGALMMKALADAGKAAREAYAEAGAVAEETFSTMRTIVAFSLENKRISEFCALLESSFRRGLREALSQGLGLGSTMCVMFLTYSLGFWYGGKLIADDIDKYGYDRCYWEEGLCATGGTTLSVFFTIVMAAFSIGQAGPSLSALGKSLMACNDLEELTTRVSLIDPEDESGFTQTEPLKGDIEFHDVHFSYPTRSERKVFGGLNLKIPAGESVALVGASGCGKSTVIQLVERFYDPLAGKVSVDGRDARDYNLKWLRGQMALVGQEPKLFATSVAENIRVGKNDASLDEIKQAAKNANAYDFIMDFPQQFDTYVGEGGGQLSGGQKQRIAIARAIIRDPAVLILDEATSALDNESEKIVQATLDEVVAQKKRTTIIIAHRLSTIRKADRIIVLDNEGEGAVVKEVGTHDSLMAIPNGLYAKLVQAHQSNAPEKEEAITELAEQFHDDLPSKSQSLVKLRSKFSRLSRDSRRSLVDETDKKTAKKKQKKWHEVFKLILPEWHYLILGLLGAAITGFIWPAFAIAFSNFLEVFFLTDAEEIRDGASKWSLIFIGYGAVIFVGMFLQQFCFGWAGQKVVRLLRENLFTSIVYQDMGYFDDPEHATGNLSNMLSTDVLSIKGWVGDNVGIYTQNIVALLAAIIIAFISSAKLAGVTLAACCIFAPAILLEAKFMGGQTDSNDAEGAASAAFILNETISNIRTIAAYTYETVMTDRYNAVVEKAYKKGARQAIITGAIWGFSQFAQYAMQATCLWYGGNLAAKGEINLQKMMQAIFALIMAAMSTGQSMALATDNTKAREAATRIYTTIDRVPPINAASPDGEQMKDVKDSIKFNSVNFRYPQRPEVQIYNNLSFEIKSGEVVALVGPSGCGKSTAVQLIERFYDVSDSVVVDPTGQTSYKSGGKITIDGSDLRDFNVKSLRSRIGLVSQEPVLFGCSIKENIALGRVDDEPTDEEIIEACRNSNAYDFISEFPEKLDTNVGKMGGKLSGGQKQRIAIARAILRDPSILILDEATSALDTESERVVQRALDDLLEQKKRSTILIAHRLTTVRQADKIVVLVNKNNRGSSVVEVGTHDQLMQIQDGVYRGLVEIAEGGSS